MSDFKSKFNQIIKNHAKEGFKEEYDRLINLLSTQVEGDKIEGGKNFLNLWVKACLEKTGRKIVKKTDPDYEDVKKYYNELKLKN